MKTFLVPVAALGLVVLTEEAASAASPAYCALYAREYANQMVQVDAPAKMTVSVQDQAYYRCLNQDEDPAMPKASAYFGADVADPGAPRAVASIDQASTSTGNKAAAPAPKAAIRTASAVASGSRAHSGDNLVDGSPEWVAKCKKYYPNSFDPKTGTVLAYHSGSRTMCPY